MKDMNLLLLKGITAISSIALFSMIMLATLKCLEGLAR